MNSNANDLNLIYFIFIQQEKILQKLQQKILPNFFYFNLNLHQCIFCCLMINKLKYLSKNVPEAIVFCIKGSKGYKYVYEYE